MRDTTLEILTYLSSCGFGTLGQDLFGPSIPSSPVNLVGLIFTGGWSHKVLFRPSLQILHRTNNAEAGLIKISSIYYALDNKTNVTCSLKGRFEAQAPPGGFYKDASNYLVYTANFVFTTPKKP